MTTSSGKSNATWALVVAGIFAYTLVTIARDPLRIHGDCALHIQAAERLLRGGLAHVDTIDTNPPLIMYLTVVPTAVAHAIGSHPIPVFLVVVWLFTLTTTFAARRLLLTALSPREAIHANLLGVSLALASFTLLAANFYGQREHLFVFGVLPYLVIRFRRWEHIPTAGTAAIIGGAVAGIAASIKPQLALIVVAPEIYWLVTRRTLQPLFRAEVSAAAGMAAAYLAHFALVPEVGAAFFGRWVPLLVRGFAAYNTTFASILVDHSNDWQPVAFALLPFAVRARSTDLAWKFARPMAIATFTATLVYVLQHKGWSYHSLPILVLGDVVVGLVAAQLLTPAADTETEPALTGALPQRVLHVALAAATALAIAGSFFLIGPSTQAQLDQLIDQTPLAREIIAHAGEGEPVLMLSTDALTPYPLVVQLRRQQSSRFLFAFPAVLLYYGVSGEPGRPFPYRGLDGVPVLPEETQFLDDLRADIKTEHPRIVLIDMLPCAGCPEGFLLHDYLERTAFLSTALSEYSRSSTVGRFAVYLRKV